MKKTKLLALLLPFAILFTGCIIYPHATDIPLIQEKNDLRIDAGVSSAATANATVSCGLTEKIALQGFGNYGAGHIYFQGAVGYYKKSGINTVWEWYTGLGRGYADAYNDAHPGYLVGNYNLGFTQFNLGKVNSRFAHADYGLSFKTGFLRTHLTDENYFDIYHSGEDPQNYQFPNLKGNNLLFQPTAFVRIGGEKLKFNLKVGTLWLYQFSHRDKRLPVSQLNVGVGLNYSFRR